MLWFRHRCSDATLRCVSEKYGQLTYHSSRLPGAIRFNVHSISSSIGSTRRGSALYTFRGKYVLITGSSSGLGSALAEALAARGANVVLNARSAKSLHRLAERLREQYPVRIEVADADISAPSAPARISRRLEQLGITIDLLINNAGVGTVGTFLSHSIDRQMVQVRLSVIGLTSLTHHFARQMVAIGNGGILNVASTSAFRPVPCMAIYGASKAFVLMFSEALAAELKESGVHIMTACPGPMATRFLSNSKANITPRNMDSADLVAERTLDDFARGLPISYPGRFRVRAATLLSGFLPRSAMVWFAMRAAKRMGFCPEP